MEGWRGPTQISCGRSPGFLPSVLRSLLPSQLNCELWNCFSNYRVVEHPSHDLSHRTVSPTLHWVFNRLIWSQTSSSKRLRVTSEGCSFSNCVTSKWLQSSSSFNLDVPRCLPYWQYCEHKESELLGLITHQVQRLTFGVCLHDQPWPCAFEKIFAQTQTFSCAENDSAEIICRDRAW